MEKQLKIYISGKITGLDMMEAYMNFDVAACLIRAAGHLPVNPATIGAVIPGMDWKTYMTIAYGVLHDPSIDAIYMLRNWKESAGAVVEWGWAQAAGLETMYQDPADHRRYRK